MRFQIRPAHLLVAALGVLLVAFAGCGDDDDGGGEPLTIEQYFEQVSAIGADTEAAVQLASDQYDEAADPEDDEAVVEAYKVFFASAQSAISDSVRRLEDVTPPDDVKAEHDAWVEVGRDYVSEIGAVEDEVSNASTPDDINDILENTPDLDAASDQFNEACAAVQQAATDNEIEADLRCEF